MTIHHATKDEAGKSYGRLTVLAHTKERRNGQMVWRCRCSCGTVALVTGSRLRIKDTQSCGCLQRERVAETNIVRSKHGGMSGGIVCPEYTPWRYMVRRCSDPSDPSYKDYGGRGIRVHPAWIANFGAFRDCVGARPSRYHTIDRHPNNDGNYEPGNVRWATKKEQARNRRNNIYMDLDGQRMLLVEACEKFSVSPALVRSRLADGWSDEEAIHTPKAPRTPRPFQKGKRKFR